MTCTKFHELSLALVALPPDDAERLAAEAHARDCEACSEAMALARSLLATVTELGAPPAASPAALERAAAPARADLARPERPRAWPAVAVVAAGALAAVLAKHRALDPASLAVAAAGLAASLLAVVLLPWRRGVAAGFAVLASLALVAAAGTGGPLDPLVGSKCTFLELLGATLPLGATAFLLRQRRGAGGAALFATAAAAGALAGQAGLHLTCPDRLSAPHLLVFHVGGVFLAVAMGWLLPFGLRAKLR
jgi:hypothetical protein